MVSQDTRSSLASHCINNCSARRGARQNLESRLELVSINLNLFICSFAPSAAAAEPSIPFIETAIYQVLNCGRSVRGCDNFNAHPQKPKSAESAHALRFYLFIFLPCAPKICSRRPRLKVQPMLQLKNNEMPHRRLTRSERLISASFPLITRLLSQAERERGKEKIPHTQEEK